MNKANIDEIMRWRGKCEALAGMFQQATMERDEARAEVERLRVAILRVQTSESAPAWFADGFHEGWTAGAKAMREAAMGAAWHSSAMALHKKIKDLPIPEEP